MKNNTKISIFIALLVFTGLTAFGQKEDFNTKGGHVLDGYDVVSYFDGKPQKGSKDFTAEYDGGKFEFSSSEHLKKFKANPSKYVPQYGGYCAYAMGKTGDKVKVDPETYEIRDGKLYLFYNKHGNNTLKSWLAESPETLKAKADSNWVKYVVK